MGRLVAATGGAAMSDRRQLEMWTVYHSPRDYRGQYVARKFVVDGPQYRPTTDVFTADSLDEIRTLLPPGLVRLPRDSCDDKNIVETWL
jgi:hypothetical protein